MSAYERDLTDARAEIARMADATRIAELENRERSHLSELADYGRTVQRLNRVVKAVREYFDGNEDIRAPNWVDRLINQLADDRLAGDPLTCSTGYCSCIAKDARIAELEGKATGLKRELDRYDHGLVAFRAYLDNYSDVEDGQGDNPADVTPNWAMRCLTELDAALGARR